MTVRKWLSRNAVWLLLAALAPVAGALTSYFVITWLASGGAESVPLPGRAEAQPSSAKGRLTIEQAQALQSYPIFWLGTEFKGMALTSIDAMQVASPAGLRVPRTDDVHLIYGDCTPSGSPPTCVPPVQINSTPYCRSPIESAGRGIFPEPPFEIRGAEARWVAGRRDTLVLFTGQSTITIITTKGEEVGLEVARRLVVMNRPGPRPTPGPTRPPGLCPGGAPPLGRGTPEGEGAPSLGAEPDVTPSPAAVELPTPVPWGLASADEPLGPVAVTCR